MYLFHLLEGITMTHWHSTFYFTAVFDYSSCLGHTYTKFSPHFHTQSIILIEVSRTIPQFANVFCNYWCKCLYKWNLCLTKKSKEETESVDRIRRTGLISTKDTVRLQLLWWKPTKFSNRKKIQAAQPICAVDSKRYFANYGWKWSQINFCLLLSRITKIFERKKKFVGWN